MSKYKQKRLSGEGSIRERKPGLWEAQYSMGSDENGRRIHKSVYGNSPEEVQEKLQKVLYSIDVGTYIEPSKMKFGEWMDM